MIMLLLVN